MFHSVLTFDDGYVRHYEIAKFLHRFGIRATFFLITGREEYRGKKLLASNPALIRKMEKMGHEIASHTSTHPNLPALSDRKIRSEVSKSKGRLSKILEGEVDGFAYPYGSHDQRVANIVREHFEYGRGAGESNRWNVDESDLFKMRGVGMKHLAYLPAQLPEIEILILVFHKESLVTLALIVSFLRLLSSDFLTMAEAASLIRERGDS